MTKMKEIRNEKEEIVFGLLKKKWVGDKILSQYRFNTPYTYENHYPDRVRTECTNRPKGTILYTLRNCKYIQVDFFNKTKNIVVEVDFLSHVDNNMQRQDEARDKQLTKIGVKTIRIKYDIGFIDGVNKLFEYYQGGK